MKEISFLAVFLMIITTACNNNRSETTQENFEYQESAPLNDEIKEVLYSMYLPTDMADIFSRSGTNFNPDIPASIENLSIYEEPEQVAVLLGILGVDLTYMKLYGQSEAAAQYLAAIRLVSQKLKIPEEVFSESSKNLEKYFSNEDSLAIVIENIYKDTDRFFKEHGYENLAALSLTGGWVEAMYIGCEILKADMGNKILAERILQQKYSLNSIYTMLRNHEESLAVSEYLLMLKKLRKQLARVEIRYQKEGFSVDTAQKKLQSYNALITYDDETMNDLLLYVPLVRNALLEPRLPE